MYVCVCAWVCEKEIGVCVCPYTCVHVFVCTLIMFRAVCVCVCVTPTHIVHAMDIEPSVYNSHVSNKLIVYTTITATPASLS